jgi:hypothetical protein
VYACLISHGSQYWKNKRVANLGYAFVNFTSYVAALRFYRYYHNREWRVKPNNKICEVSCAKIQVQNDFCFEVDLNCYKFRLICWVMAWIWCMHMCWMLEVGNWLNVEWLILSLLQGKEALVTQFKNSVFWCHTDTYLPVVFVPACDGVVLPKTISVGHRVCAPSRKPRTKWSLISGNVHEAEL